MVMRRAPLLASVMALLAVAACVCAQNPIANGSFEQEFVGWMPYQYEEPPYGGAGLPWVANVGSGGFDVLIPTPPVAPDGTKVCGIQSWGSSKNGGVSQQFIWTGGQAVISVTARAYSVTFPPGYVPYDNGCRVRMGLAPVPTDDRLEVNSWTTFPWGDAWNTLTLNIPGPGDYTLFIEGVQPDAAAIMSTLWDKVAFSVLPLVTVTDGPTFDVPGDPMFPDTTIQITWMTNVLSTTRVDYGPDSGYGQFFEDPTPTTLHEVIIRGLPHSSAYHFRASSTAPGHVDWTSTDTVVEMPIQFRDINTRLAADGVNTVISWTTDVATTTQVEYGKTTSYGSFTTEDTVLRTEHEVTLSGLDEDQEYHFRVWARNPAGHYNDAHSDDYVFLSLPVPSLALANGGFEDAHESSAHSLYPWVKYTVYVPGSGFHPIDGLVGPYPKGGPAQWPNHPPSPPYPPAIQACEGSYFVGAASQLYFKNGGVLQRVVVEPNRDYTLSANYATYRLGGTPYDTRIRLGMDPNGGTDPLSPAVTWWSTYSDTNDERWHKVGLTAKTGPTGMATVFLDIVQTWPLQWHVVAVDNATFGVTPVRSVGSLKSSTTGLGAILENKVVTHTFFENVEHDSRYYRLVYIEEEDRSAGIAVLLDVNGADFPEAGNKLTLTGSLIERKGEATVVANTWTVDHNTYDIPAAVGINQKHLGGATANQPGLYSQNGPCNVGLRVRVYGRVNGSESQGEAGTDSLTYVDDGTGIMDGNLGNVKGLRVFCVADPTQGVAEGDYIAASGVLTIQLADNDGWTNGNEYFVYTVYTRAPGDWTVLSVP